MGFDDGLSGAPKPNASGVAFGVRDDENMVGVGGGGWKGMWGE